MASTSGLNFLSQKSWANLVSIKDSTSSLIPMFSWIAWAVSSSICPSRFMLLVQLLKSFKLTSSLSMALMSRRFSAYSIFAFWFVLWKILKAMLDMLPPKEPILSCHISTALNSCPATCWAIPSPRASEAGPHTACSAANIANLFRAGAVICFPALKSFPAADAVK